MEHFPWTLFWKANNYGNTWSKLSEFLIKPNYWNLSYSLTVLTVFEKINQRTKKNEKYISHSIDYKTLFDAFWLISNNWYQISWNRI